jgi:hypothetical protein
MHRSQKYLPQAWQTPYSVAHRSGSASAVGLPPGIIETEISLLHVEHPKTVISFLCVNFTAKVIYNLFPAVNPNNECILRRSISRSTAFVGLVLFCILVESPEVL